jgi:hypothetical protein
MIKRYFQTIDLGFRDIAAIFIVLGIAGGLLFMSLKFPGGQSASGFGPEWQCTGRGARGAGPDFCIKKDLLKRLGETPPKS